MREFFETIVFFVMVMVGMVLVIGVFEELEIVGSSNCIDGKIIHVNGRHFKCVETKESKIVHEMEQKLKKVKKDLNK